MSSSDRTGVGRIQGDGPGGGGYPDEVRFGVLGTLTVVDDDGGIRPLGGPARRRLLAALVARHGRTVSVDSLLSDLWGDTPPATAEKTLQSHVVRLRDALGRDEGGSPIRTDPTGYRLNVEPAAVDAWCFERDLTAGRQALAARDLASAAVLLDQALAWWRDDAYIEFPEAAFAVIERLRLFELRCLAAEARTDVALELGAGAELVGDLETRVREDPYRERTWEQLVIVLYRSGRQADALTAYRRARERLVEDLGVEPSPVLRALEARVLDQDPTLDAPVRPDTGGGTVPSPSQAKPSTSATATETEAVPLDPASPYRGLASYGEDDTAVFVGRERLTAELCGRLVDNDLLVVTGPSGAGKSSLLRAGLAPALRRGAVPGSKAWRIRIVTPGVDPLDALDTRRCELLIVDQAEELFTLGNEEDLRRVRMSLTATLRAGTMIVLAVRGDFYGRLADLDLLTRRIGGATVLVGPMTADETRRVVVEPAARHGVTVEPDLVDDVLTDVAGRSGALPLLSAALEQAWAHRTGDRLTLEDYRRGGGVRGALEAMAEDTYASLDPEARVAARRILLRLTTLSGGAWVRRPMPLADLVPDDDDAARRAVEVLAARRLVLVGAAGVELTHESLLTGWPRLGRWLEERAMVAGQLEHLASSAVVWDRIGRPDAELLRGPRLQAALDWRGEHSTDLSSLEQDYLTASQRAVGEALRTERRRRRWLTAAVAAVAAFALLATLVGAVAVRERQAADQVALAADAGRLAALSATAGDIPTSMLMAAAAYRLTDSPETRGALLSAEQRSSGELFRQTFDNQLLWVGPVGDGSRLLVMDNQRTMLTIDVTTRTILSRFGAPGDVPGGMSPDGKTLVMCGVGDAGAAALVDAATGAVLRTITSRSTTKGLDSCGAFSGDGRSYVVMLDLPVPGSPFVAGQDAPNAVAVYRTADWSAPPRVLHVDAPVTAFDVGASELALQLEDGTLDVVSASTLAVQEHAVRPELANNCAYLVCDIALSPDASWLAFVDPTAAQSPRLVGTAALGGRTVSGQGTSASISAMDFSGDGAALAIGASDGSFLVVDSATASTITSQPGNGGSIQGIAWAGHPSAQHLYTVGLDDSLTSWQLSLLPHDLALGATLLVDDGDATHLGDRIMATAGESVFIKNLVTGLTVTWPFDLATGEQLQWLLPSNDWSRAVLASSFADGSARFLVVDMANGQTLLDHRVPTWHDKNDPLVAAFTADGTSLFTASGHDRIDVLDIATDRVVRSFSVRFPGSAGDRMWVLPLGTDPQGRLLVEGDDSIALTATNAGRWGGTGSTSSPTAPTPSDQVAVVDPSTGAVIASTVIGPVPPWTWEWSPDASRLVIGTTSGTLQVFDASTLSPLTPRVLAHSGDAFAGSFSPDGSMIVSSGSDGNVIFWDASTLHQLGSSIRLGPTSRVFAWYLPDGRVAGMMPSTPAGTAPNRLFAMAGTPSAWLRDACAFAARDLGPQEWARLVPDQPYRPTCPTGSPG